MDVCLRVLKESIKCRFDSYSVRKLYIALIPYHLAALSCTHFSDNLSRNSCIFLLNPGYVAALSLGSLRSNNICGEQFY